MKSKLIVVMLLAAGAVFASVSIGIRIGAPPPVRVSQGSAKKPWRRPCLGRGLLVP